MQPNYTMPCLPQGNFPKGNSPKGNSPKGISPQNFVQSPPVFGQNLRQTTEDIKNIIEAHIQDDLDTHDFSKSHIDRKQIENLVGMRVKNISYYQRALVHKSITRSIKQYEGPIQEYLNNHNERIEFLGDSVLGMIVANYLYHKYPDNDEGFLTKMRIKIVNGTRLSLFAKSLNLGKYILMSTHVVNIGGRESVKILEDAFEALIGAIFKDMGFEAAEHFVINIVSKLDFVDLQKEDNFKDVLLRYCHNNSWNLPTYECLLHEGPAHNRRFKIGVKINETLYGTAMGASKKKAEQLAAKETLSILKVEYT